MTPQEQAFNNQIESDQSFTLVREEVSELKQGQSEIKATLKKEVESAQKFENYVQNEFNKGTAKFTKVEARMGEIEDKMEKGLEKIAESQMALANEIKDSRIEQLTKKIEREEDSKSNLQTNIIVGLTLLLLGAVGTLTLKLIGTNGAVVAQTVSG